MLQDAMWAVLTDTERERVTELLNTGLMSKPADEFLAGEYVQVTGQITLGHGRWLKRGIYCVLRWHPNHLELMPYGKCQRIEVPHGLTLTKYPLELLVLSERAAARVIVNEEAAA